MKNRCGTIIFLLFIVMNSFADNTLRLLNSEGIPIPYATIYNTITSAGTISNSEGMFMVSGKSLDFIEISCLGYQGHRATLESLTKDSIIVLEKQVITLDEFQVNFVDAASIIKKSKTRIKKNYPKKKIQIGGIYKEFSKIDSTYYGFLQADIDVYIKSLVSRSLMQVETQVSTYKVLKNKNSQSVMHIRVQDHLRSLYINNYLYLLNRKKYNYEYYGYLPYDDLRLLKISFESKEKYSLYSMTKGYFYIDSRTYGIVFIKFETILNDKSYRSFGGISQKGIKNCFEILFECDNDLYYPTRIVSKHTGSMIVSDWTVKPENINSDTVNVESRFNFFKRDIDFYPNKYVYIEELSLDSICKRGDINNIEENGNYKSDFLLELDEENLLNTYAN